MDRIAEIMDNSVKCSEAVGAGCLVFKDGKELYSHFSGHADKSKNIPMQRNTIATHLTIGFLPLISPTNCF